MRWYPHGLFTHLKLVHVSGGRIEVGVGYELAQSREHVDRREFLVGGDALFKLIFSDTHVEVNLKKGSCTMADNFYCLEIQYQLIKISEKIISRPCQFRTCSKVPIISVLSNPMFRTGRTMRVGPVKMKSPGY